MSVIGLSVRKCFKMGDDSVSGKNFDHREVWIEEYLHQFAAPFGNKQIPSSDAFLSPLMIDELADPVGPCASESRTHCSDKGFLAMSIEEYLELLDWSARQVVRGKRGSTPAYVPPVLKRLGLDGASWCELVSDFGRLFCTVAGRPEQVDTLRSHRTRRSYHLRRHAQELFASQ